MAHIEDGNANAVFMCSKEKKNIFLIGDSIRLGYCAEVKKELSDIAEVFYLEDNCRNTQYVIPSLEFWKNMISHPERIDVIHFNCGHWDVAHCHGSEFSLTSPEEYAQNIKVIIWLLKKLFVNAKIIFATTTPMNPNGIMGLNPRSNEEIDNYNRLAVEVCKENGVEVNDLNSFARSWGSEYFADYCHFTPETNKLLGKKVADVLKSASNI